MQQWLAHAPANIALIKYMGKDDQATNLPANPSLSFTLNWRAGSCLNGENFGPRYAVAIA